MRYNGQDYRFDTQHGNNSHERSEYARHDHTSNTWRNSRERTTNVTPEIYTEPRDENKTYDSYTTQYMDIYAQHNNYGLLFNSFNFIQFMNVCQSTIVSHNRKAVISMCSLNVCELHSKLNYNILQNYILKIRCYMSNRN